jgi:choline dehydrogenase-like flavoprotein
MIADLSKLLVTQLGALAAETVQDPLDAVVIGAGTAGITSARTLGENSQRRVAILEAGLFPLFTHISNTGLRFEPTAARAVQRLLEYSAPMAGGGGFGNLIGCVGGRGMFWNGAAPHYSPDDFDGWPLGYADLTDAFVWAKEQLRVTDNFSSPGLLGRVRQRLAHAGIEATPCPFAIDTSNTSAGNLGGMVGNSVAPLLESRSLTRRDNPVRLCIGTFVSAIITNNKNTRAEGVRVRRMTDAKCFDLRARVVVLAAGALESTRLALASRLPDPSRLMGRFVTDHVFCRAYYPAPHLYDLSTPEAAMLIMRANHGRRYQVEVHLPGDYILALSRADPWVPDKSPKFAAMVRSFGPTRPRYENYVEPVVGQAPGAMLVHFTYSSDDDMLRDDMLAALEQTRIALGAGEAPQVQTLPPGASHHEAGGMIMGDDPHLSVTDSFGRVRAMPNVVCTDAATWPVIAATNPHVTIAAIARRQSLAIDRDLL